MDSLCFGLSFSSDATEALAISYGSLTTLVLSEISLLHGFPLHFVLNIVYMMNPKEFVFSSSTNRMPDFQFYLGHYWKHIILILKLL